MLSRTKKSILVSLVTATLMSGCGSEDISSLVDSSQTSSIEVPSQVSAALSGETSTISEAVKNDLAYMGNEERLAYDVYNKLYESFPNLQQLHNIPMRAEIKHIEAVKGLIEKYAIDGKTLTVTDIESAKLSPDTDLSSVAGSYDIQVIQDLYDQLILKGKQSEMDALQVGCMIEVVDIDDLDKYLLDAQESAAEDVVTVFDFLRDGSYSHYWAFDKGLQNIGISDGCCSLGEEYCKTEAEYPKEEKGNGNGGVGNGYGYQ